jgi:hypothetical protein
MFSLKHVLNEATFNQQRTRFWTPFFCLCKSIFFSCILLFGIRRNCLKSGRSRL